MKAILNKAIILFQRGNFLLSKSFLASLLFAVFVLNKFFGNPDPGFLTTTPLRPLGLTIKTGKKGFECGIQATDVQGIWKKAQPEIGLRACVMRWIW